MGKVKPWDYGYAAIPSGAPASRCRQSHHCTRTASHMCWFSYRKPDGQADRQTRILCPEHTRVFAEKHGLGMSTPELWEASHG